MSANLKGNNVSGATPEAGQALVWDGNQWAPGSPGGGITQLTGDAQAGPGSGSVSSIVTGAHGVFNGNNDVFSFAQSRGSLGTPTSKFAGWDGSGVAWFGSGCDGDGGTSRINIQSNVLTFGPTYSGGAGNVLTMARAGNYYHHVATFLQGLSLAQHARISTNYQLDGGGSCDYFVETAYLADSGGVIITTPATPWSDLGSSPGRTFVVADVLGTCSVADPIVLTDPTGRTFNGVAGPYTITKPSNVCTITLDSTLTNWILGFQSGSPI